MSKQNIINFIIISLLISLFSYQYYTNNNNTKKIINNDNIKKNITNNIDSQNKKIDNNYQKIDKKNEIQIELPTFLGKRLDSDKFSHIWGLENVTDNNGTLKIHYPAGSYKPSVEPIGGAGFIFKLDKGLENAKLSYKIKFDENFDFVKGGKLPGFCGGTCPRGGEDGMNGFSTRFMWRKEGKIEIYAYLPENKYITGQGYGRGTFIFEKNKFYEITQELKLNDIGEKNGVIIISIDGKEVYRNSKINYRTNESIKIDSILFSTFFGGGDKSYATPNDTDIYLKDFKIYE